MGVEIELAGRLVIRANGTVLEDRGLGGNGRVAFAYLVVERHRPVTRDELADIVWGADVPPTWQTAIRGIVARIRGVLGLAGLAGSDALRTEKGCYQLHLPPGAQVDVDEAGRALERSRRRLAAGDAGAARTAAEMALTVARQPFLAGATGLWVEQRQAELDDLRLAALESLADAAAAAGDWAASLEAAHQAVARAPLRESAHRRVVASHAGAGNRGDALRAYERCRRILADELGVNPSPETEELYRTLLGEEPQSPQAAAEPAPGPSPELPQPLRHRATPFVGRTAELADLRAAWTRARTRPGDAGVVVVAGEAGIGKTRLAGWLAAEARADGASVLYGRCDEEGLLPYQPVIEALSRYVSQAPAAVLADQFGAAGALPRLVPALAERLPAARWSEPGDAGDRRVLFEAARLAFVRLARAAPLLVVVDDVHWADQPTMAMVRHLLRSPDPAAALFVLTHREGEPGARPLAALLAGLRRERPVTALTLTGLAEPDVAALVEAWAGHAPSAALAAVIHDDTGGNPFFVEEVLRLMAERGLLGLAGGLASADALGDLGISPRVREVVASRAARLLPAAGRVVAAAAVAGREIDLALLETLDDLRGVDVLDGVEAAVSARLLVEVPGVVGRFAFPHALVREAIYEELTAARRQRLHGQIAAVLTASSTAVPAAQLARHLLAAGPAVREQTVAVAAQAADDASAVFAYEEAARFYELAIGALGEDSPDQRHRAELLLELAGAQWRGGDVRAARATFDHAASVAAAASEADLAAWAGFGAAGGGPTLGATDSDNVDRLTAALDAGASDPAVRARLHARLGTELAATDPRTAVEHGQRAVELASGLGDPAVLAFALHCERFAQLAVEDPTAALEVDGRIFALGDQAGDRHMILESHILRFTHLLSAGRATDAAAEIEVVDQLAQELRQPFYQRYPLRFHACLALAAGRFDVAASLAGEAYAIERRVHPSDADVHAGLFACVLHWEQQHLDALDRAAEELQDIQPAAPLGRAARAYLAAVTGRDPHVRQELRALLDGEGALAPFTLAMAAETAIALDDGEGAAAVARRLEPWRDRDLVAGAGVVWLGSVVGLLGRLAIVRAEPSDARLFLVAAVARDAANGAERARLRAERALAERALPAGSPLA